MSQYQDYFFSDGQRQDEIQMLKSPFICEDRGSEMSFGNPYYFQKDLPPTELIQDVTELELQEKKPQNSEKVANFQKQKRIKRSIFLDQERKTKRKQIFRGLKNDTMELNFNFKTILMKELKELMILRQIDQEEKQIFNNFGKSVASFSELKKLLKSDKIKQKSLKMIKSEKIIKQIMKGKSSIPIKMTMLKYIENFKQNFQSQKIIKWKDLIKQ